MYVSDIKKEFYEFLMGKHIVILVHYDIDALCTCRILQTLIKYDSIQYTLIPIRGMDDLRKAYRENHEQIHIFVLINCGGSVDLVEYLDPDERSVFFVLDTHRPTDVCNIYSDTQIRLLWQQEDDQNVPDFEDIFKEDDGEDAQSDGDDGEDDEEQASKRRRLGEEDILKRRDRRLWEEKRNKLMFEYSQYTYYSQASAITVFKLAHMLAKDSKELLWLTILALSSQQILGMIESSQYIVYANNIQLEVSRLNQRQNAMENNTTSALSISIEQDIKLPLFRHWSIEKSITCSVYLGTKLKLWTRRGERKMQELFADMGLPLAQTKQTFSAMELTYRNEFVAQLEKCTEKFGITDLMYPSFLVKYGYRLRYGAADMVYILIAVLEQMGKSGDSGFSDALDCLARPPPVHLVTRGLEQAKITLETCQKIMKAALDQKKIFSAGPFLYFIVHESMGDSYLFSKPHTLLLLARYIQHAYCERQGGRTSANAMPLLISAPIAGEQPEGEHSQSQSQSSQNIPNEAMCLLLGLPPLCENSPKSFFGKAFEQVAERTLSIFIANYFDTSYCEMRIGDRTRFLDSLTALLS